MWRLGYTGSFAGSQSLRGGDTSDGTSYTSTPELRRFIPVDSNGMPIDAGPLIGQHHTDVNLEHSPRAPSLGPGEAARMTALNSLNGSGDRNGYMRGQHCSNQAAAGESDVVHQESGGLVRPVSQKKDVACDAFTSGIFRHSAMKMTELISPHLL